MGNERRGYKRMVFFLNDNTALQLRENAYRNHETLTDYMTGAILRRIEDERIQRFEDAKKSV